MNTYRIISLFNDLSVSAERYVVERESMDPRLVFYVGEEERYALPLDQIKEGWGEDELGEAQHKENIVSAS